MPVELNHTIVVAHDKHVSAAFTASVLGLELGTPWGPFAPVTLDNGVTLDFMDAADLGQAEIRSQHYAFQVSPDEFDAIRDRLVAAGITYYADPFRTKPGRVNDWGGGRGLFFADPADHNLEVLTGPVNS
jgi:hypothetical protein